MICEDLKGNIVNIGSVAGHHGGGLGSGSYAAAKTPLGRNGIAEDVAKAILFLAGDAASLFVFLSRLEKAF